MASQQDCEITAPAEGLLNRIAESRLRLNGASKKKTWNHGFADGAKCQKLSIFSIFDFEFGKSRFWVNGATQEIAESRL